VDRHLVCLRCRPVVAEPLDDRLLVVAGGAQEVTEPRGSADVWDRVEALAAQVLNGTRRGR
jgi:hypothetical protein